MESTNKAQPIHRAPPTAPTAWVNEAEGWASRRIFVDSDIYELEIERVFNRSWLLLGHESELPRPGDYITRPMGDDLVIVVRGEDGVIRAFLNSCRHRGTQLCRADGGNTKHFTCPYHTWTYDTQGRLLSTSFDQYYDRRDFAQLGLIPVAQFDTYGGLLFATWNPQAPPLKTYLGDLTWYLDMIFRRTPGGMELINPPQRCVVETNWKITALNFMDGQHAARVHRGPMEIAASSGPIAYADILRVFAHSPQMSFPNGHGCLVIPLPEALPDFCGLSPELAPLYRDTLNAGQYDLLRRLFASVGTIFPNLSWVHPVLVVAPDRPPFAFLSLRLWQPLGPQKIEVWNWYFIDREASAEWKEAARRNAVRTFSVSGLLEEDDVEVWAALTRATRGSIARRYTADFRAGATIAPVTDFPGPGTVSPSSYPEGEQFNFLRHWQQCMAQVEP